MIKRIKYDTYIKNPINIFYLAYVELNNTYEIKSTFNTTHAVKKKNLGRLNVGLIEARYVINRGRNANGVWAIWSDGAIELFGSGVNPIMAWLL